MRKTSTLTTGLPNVGGKVCAQHVRTLWDACAHKFIVTHSRFSTRTILWKNQQSSPTLYTNCIQLFHVLVGNFTPVSTQFCTVYTGPIKTTTTYINRRRIV